MTTYLVVARHPHDDSDWIKGICSAVTKHVLVKGEHLPNIGREASTYLSWMLMQQDMYSLYRYPAEGSVAIFCQGYPLDHCEGFVQQVNAIAEGRETIAGFTPLGDSRLMSDGTGGPHHKGLGVKIGYDSLLYGAGATWPGKKDQFAFVPGAQFAIPMQLLLDTKREVFRRMLIMSMETNGPYQLERLWGTVFTESAFRST